MLNPAVSNATPRSPLPHAGPALLAPSLSDLLFIALLLWLLIFTNSGAPAGLLQDAGAGVHIRTGDWILSNHAVPRVDPFSFSKPGQPWFAWEWLTDVFFAELNLLWGLKGLVLFSGAALALVCCLVVRHMVVAGANALAALVVMHAVIAAGSVHFLARPHIFTLLFLAGSFYVIDRDRARPTKLIWLLVPLTAVWANLHGGFTGIILTLGALAAGSVLEMNWRNAARYASLCAACLGASLLNPYGYHLHEHVVEFLRAGWIRGIVLEFQPPRLDTAPGVYFEVLLFLGVALAAKLAYREAVRRDARDPDVGPRGNDQRPACADFRVPDRTVSRGRTDGPHAAGERFGGRSQIGLWNSEPARRRASSRACCARVSLYPRC